MNLYEFLKIDWHFDGREWYEDSIGITLCSCYSGTYDDMKSLFASNPETLYFNIFSTFHLDG